MEEQMPRTGAPIVALALAALVATSVVQAQEWPTRPVTMVVPFAAGGPVDVLGRILAQYLGETIGKQVIVDNVPGGGGMTGSLRVSQAAPDGYMFVLASIGTHALNQTLSKKPLYNAATDFVPVALIADVGLVLITRKDLPANNLAEFIAYAKANQGKMQFGSGGAGTSSHIGCVLLNQTIGVDTTHVPYRGGGPAMADLFAGRVDYVCNIASTVGQAVEGKQAKAIAALTRERSPILPDLPTAHEQGLAGFDAYTWNAVFQGHAAGALEKAQPGAGDGDGKSRLPGASSYPRPHRRGAGAPDPRLSADLRRKRDRQVGGPDQGERREGRLIDSFVTKREQQMDTAVRHVHAHSRR
jgi:tripartite-type tricarboxylate transporter receptor subunit TctC